MSAIPASGPVQPSKDEAAEHLARAHYALDPAIVSIYRVVSPSKESSSSEPIKLLEINPHTIPTGILPVRFGPHAPSGVPYSSIIIEISESEWNELQAGTMQLPNGWKLETKPYER